MDQATGIIDCACVIHGDRYAWQYVERLHSMLSRHLSPQVRLHVYTEADRVVPPHMVKHALTDWNISNPKQLWWYKLQLFDPARHAGPMLYFDLDTVIVKNIDWIWHQTLNYFWAPRDFKYLWSPNHQGINSSIMWWDTRNYQHVWTQFDRQKNIAQYRGDQDYISHTIIQNQRRFMDTQQVLSWRWQCLDGGYNFKKKQHCTPGTGTVWSDTASVLIFHGAPKPDQIYEDIIAKHWC